MADLYLGGGPVTDTELAALDEVLPRESVSPQHMLLPALHALNDRVGWISRAALDEVARRTDVAPAVSYGVATFYSMFSTSPRPPAVAYLCDDVPCRLAGATKLAAELAEHWPEREARAGAVWERSQCLGLCEYAPAALIDGLAMPHATARGVTVGLAEPASRRAGNGGPPPAGDPPPPRAGAAGEPRLLRLILEGVAPTLDAYSAHGGFAGLRRAMELGPVRALEVMKAAGLVGRGGAAFPTAVKWEAVARHPVRPHYLVVNADESETGTFKDRVLLEWDPFAVLEGTAIAAFLCGVEQAFVYLRGEYPHAAARLGTAIAELEGRDWLGLDLGVELRRGAGAYICGEETALFNSLEGRRGEPRAKPPYPVEAGLFGKPTVINNVETLANVPFIMAEGAAAYRAAGTGDSPGTKLFALSGHVERPGVYEVPFGTPLRTLVDGLGGGVRDGMPLRAIQCGGAAGTFLTPADLDVPLTFEDLRARGASIGSGALVVLDETADLMEVAIRGAEFFAHESCGQCVPCRVGTQRQVELLQRMADGEDVTGLLAEVAKVMRDASICGLGQTAASMVQSAVNELGLR